MPSLVARAPTRIDFGGGWTDVPPYATEQGGVVCNLAINRYATVHLDRAEPGDAIEETRERALADAALRVAALRGVHARVHNDFPLGAGLGGSSAAGVAMMGAIEAWHAVARAAGVGDAATLPPAAMPAHVRAVRDLVPADRTALAEASRRVEVEELHIAGGRQDHYAAAYGGALSLSFGERTTVHRLALTRPMVRALEARCVVVYTGQSRISGDTISAVLDAYAKREGRVLTALARMKALAEAMADALVAEDLDALGMLVGEHWVHQRALHPAITTPLIDRILAVATAAGAIGGKALGASGGGCVLLVAAHGFEEPVRRAIETLATPLPFSVDQQGFAWWPEGDPPSPDRDVTVIPPGDAIALLRQLVAVDSRNPSLVPGAPGEGEVARTLAATLASWGFRTSVVDAAPGRPNVVARIGRPGGRVLLFNGHLDVVGVDGMLHPPFSAEERDGRIYGRGSCDMKGGVAAMCAAAVRAAAEGLDGEVVIAAVADEEYESLGTRALVASGLRADAAIVTEPTRLAINPAHRGFVWVELDFRGRAAHGSRYDLGVDAIRHAGLVIAALDQLQRDILDQRTHPLLGHASLHLATIAGGSGWSTYPDRCTLRVERRTLPGESTDQVLQEFAAACARVAAQDDALDVQVRHVLTQGPSDVAGDAPIVRALEAAMRAEGETVLHEGMSAWTDAALLNDAGIPAICYGPGDIVLAHADEEWIPLDEVERATRVLSRLAQDWMRGPVA